MAPQAVANDAYVTHGGSSESTCFVSFTIQISYQNRCTVLLRDYVRHSCYKEFTTRPYVTGARPGGDPNVSASLSTPGVSCEPRDRQTSDPWSPVDRPRAGRLHDRPRRGTRDHPHAAYGREARSVWPRGGHPGRQPVRRRRYERPRPAQWRRHPRLHVSNRSGDPDRTA